MALTVAQYVNMVLKLTPEDRAEVVRQLRAADDKGGADHLGPGLPEEMQARVDQVDAG